MSRPRLRVGIPTVEAHRVVVPVEATGPRSFRRVLREQPWIEYDFDPSGIQSGVLAMPAVASLLPLAWVYDAEMDIEVLDSEYREAIPEMRIRWLTVYSPSLSAIAPDPAGASLSPDGRVAVSLYSGGIDSTASALAHRSEDLTLCQVWGIDVPVDRPDLWRPSRDHMLGFARNIGASAAVVRSNVRRFLDERTLDHRHGSELAQWWRASHGLVLPAMAAPVAAQRGADTIYMPATHEGGYDAPYGSQPAIDESSKFTGIRVVHDGFDRSRTDKIVAISEDLPDEPVVVCRSGAATGRGNCSRCEKCLRTTVAMASMGIDPNRHGLVLDDRTIEDLRRLVDSGILGSSDTPFFWRRVRDRARTADRPSDPVVARLIDYAAAIDVEGLWSTVRLPWRRRVRRGVGRLIPHRLRPAARRVYLRLFRHW